MHMTVYNLQEMFQEYWRGHQLPESTQSFRLTLMLFNAFDPDSWYEIDAEVEITSNR